MKCRSGIANGWFWTTPIRRAHDEKNPTREEVRTMALAPAVPLSAAIAEHLASTEGEHGLYAEIVAAAPRLAFAVETLIREHAELRLAMKRDFTNLDDEQLADLARRLDRHCQRGNDLVYEAYVRDLGGEH